MLTNRPAFGVRVALYEDGERLLLHRSGSPLVVVVATDRDGRFRADAEALAAGALPVGDGGVVDLRQLAPDLWPDRTAQLVALWEDGHISGPLLADRGGDASVAEPSWRVRRYVGPIQRR